MAINVGSVSVEVMPDARGWSDKLRSQIGDLSNLGERIGRQIGDAAARAAARAIADGIDEGVRAADPTAEAAKKGKSAGGAFARAAKAEIEAALRNLPDVDINGNPDGALADIAIVRDDLEKLRDKKIGVDISGAEALAEIERIKTELNRIRDEKVEINFDVNAASEALTRLQQKIANDAGGTFDRTLRDSLARATAGLPDIKIQADTSEAEQKLAVIKGELVAFRDIANIDLNIDAATALADVETIRLKLLALVNDETVDIKVRVDAAAALASLDAIVAASQIPDVVIDIDPTPAQRAFLDLRAEFDAFKDIQIGVDIDDVGALRNLEALRVAVLNLANSSPSVTVRLEAAAFLAEIAAATAAVEGIPDVQIGVEERNPGKFATELRAKLLALQASLPDIEIRTDTSQATRDVAILRRTIGEIHAQLIVDGDVAKAMAALALVKAEADKIDLKRVDINVRVDAAGVIAELGAIGVAAEAAGTAGAGGLSHIQLILAAIVLLFPIVAAAVVALAGAFALIVTPIAAIALGLDGIKAAAAPLQAAFTELKNTVSAVFTTGLGPAIQGILSLMPTLTTGLVGAARALSDMANQVVRVATSGANLGLIANSFQLINQTIALGTPALSALTENIIRLTNLGVQGMQVFAVQLQAVGAAWTRVIDSLTATGVGVASVQALFTILASLLTLLAPLTELGATMLASFGPVLAGAIDILTIAIQAFNTVLGILPQSLQAVVTALVLIIGTLAILGKLPLSISGSFAAMATSFVGVGATAAGAAVGIKTFGLALLSLLTNPIVLLIAAVTIGLSLLTSAQNAAATAAANHASAVTNLSAELEKSGNIVTQGTRAYIAQSETFKTVAAGAKDVGVSLDQVTDAATGNGAAFDSLRAKLVAQVDANHNWLANLQDDTSATEIHTIALNDQGDKAQAALLALDELNKTYVDSVQRNKDLSEALRETGISTVAGAAGGAALKTALAALKDEMSTTAERATALHTALLLLAGGTVPFEQALSGLRATMAGLGDAFTKARDEAVAAKVPFIDNTGAINTLTDAGRSALDVTLKLGEGMAQTATAAFEAEGGQRNLTAALAAANKVAVDSRNAFIQAVDPLHKNAAAAGELADRYGLIPKLVTTLLEAKGVPEVNQELLQINSLIKQFPNNVPINIGVVAPETIKILQAIGFAVTQIPSTGEVTITATDKTRQTLDAVQANAASTVAAVPITAANQTGAGVSAAVQDIQTRKDALLPVSANVAPIAPAVQTAATAVAALAPAQMPVGANTAPVVPAAQAAANQVTGITATLNVEPGGLAFLRTAVDNIRLSIATPVNFSVGMTDNVTRQLQPLQALVQTPLNIPVSATDVGAAGLINALRSNAIQIVAMPVTATDSGASGLINSLRGNAQTVSVMPISADPSLAQGILANLVATITGTTAVMHIDSVVDLATAKLAAFVAVVTATIAIMKIDADPALATQKLADLVTKINGTTGTVKINADVAAAEAAITNLARPRTTTLTVNIATTGALPNARGNIVPAGFSFFANGGFKGMSANRAAIVPPNAPRVIGDRSHDDEAFIPINSSARSRALLGITAGAMGFGLLPMAAGGLVGGIDNTLAGVLRLANGLSGKVSTQSSSPFLGPNDGPGSNGGLGNNETTNQKLDQVVAALKEIKPGPGSITVEDRSGNPVETARATQLALKLAR